MIVLRLLFTLLGWALWILDIAILVYVVLSWIRPTGAKWMALLARICEPLLLPARRLIGRILPSRFMIMDWSPILVWIVLGIARNLLGLLERIIL